MPLREHCSQPRGKTAAAVKIAEQRAFEQLSVNTVGQLTRAPGGVERIRRAIQDGTMFADEVLPRGVIAGGAAARERQVLEMERAKVGASLGASLERLSKALERHAPSLGMSPAMEPLDELRVDGHPSHSTPCALVGDDRQEHTDGHRKQRWRNGAAECRDNRRPDHDDDETRRGERGKNWPNPQRPRKDQP